MQPDIALTSVVVQHVPQGHLQPSDARSRCWGDGVGGGRERDNRPTWRQDNQLYGLHTMCACTECHSAGVGEVGEGLGRRRDQEGPNYQNILLVYRMRELLITNMKVKSK